VTPRIQDPLRRNIQCVDQIPVQSRTGPVPYQLGGGRVGGLQTIGGRRGRRRRRRRSHGRAATVVEQREAVVENRSTGRFIVVGRQLRWFRVLSYYNLFATRHTTTTATRHDWSFLLVMFINPQSPVDFDMTSCRSSKNE
jgi:hypothetical protein